MDASTEVIPIDSDSSSGVTLDQVKKLLASVMFIALIGLALQKDKQIVKN